MEVVTVVNPWHYLNCLILILFRSDILESARKWNESTSNFTIIKMESPKQYFCSMLSSLLSVDGYVVSPPIMIDYGRMIKLLHSVMQFRCLNTKFFSVERILRRHHTTIIYHLLSMDRNVVSLLFTIDYGHLIKEMNKEMNFWRRND